MTGSQYTAAFFDSVTHGSIASARSIVPVVVELVRPKSVVDVGCGIGAWLHVFQEHGVSEVVGVDGEYVVREQLLIPQGAFTSHDLEQPLRLDRRFDLAVSLEVAEHLAEEAAAAFVESLVRLAPIVLFSAAIPHQGGVDHRNERWPGYWAELFRGHGYEAVDCIRPRVWEDNTVEYWYAQNILLYVERGELDLRDALLREQRAALWLPLAIVHPRAYAEVVEWLAGAPSRLTTRELVRLLPAAMRRTVVWRLGRR